MVFELLTKTIVCTFWSITQQRLDPGADPRMVRIGTGPPFWQINHANSAYFRLFLGYFGVISVTRPPLLDLGPLFLHILDLALAWPEHWNSNAILSFSNKLLQDAYITFQESADNSEITHRARSVLVWGAVPHEASFCLSKYEVLNLLAAHISKMHF